MGFSLKKSKSLSLIFFIGICGILTSCNQDLNTGFNGKSYDISQSQDGSLNVKIDKITGGYKLTLSGKGETKDFSDEEKTPWYSISPKISEVEIEEGITGLGQNIFDYVDLNYFYLPSTLTNLENNSFESGTTLYSYSTNELTNASNYDVYYFSESRPLDSTKKYFHIVDETPVAWILSTMNALFIGNSFTYYNDMPQIVQSIAKDIGYDLKTTSITKGSHTLTKFADSNDEMGKIVDETLKGTTKFDYVILQEQSTRSYSNYDSFKSGVDALVTKINEYQPNADIRLYETWGFEEEAISKKWTVPEMENEIAKKYEDASKDKNLKIHYVGEAFSVVYENHKEINLYDANDNKHPSYAGSYLSALVHVASLFDCDVRVTKFNGTLDETTANTLKQVAYNVVLN